MRDVKGLLLSLLDDVAQVIWCLSSKLHNVTSIELACIVCTCPLIMLYINNCAEIWNQFGAASIFDAFIMSECQRERFFSLSLSRFMVDSTLTKRPHNVFVWFHGYYCWKNNFLVWINFFIAVSNIHQYPNSQSLEYCLVTNARTIKQL